VTFFRWGKVIAEVKRAIGWRSFGNMEEYYRRRAKIYEEFYQGSNYVRQRELEIITDALRKTFEDRRVLDVACGTGYWTKTVSETARSIVGVDVAQEMLEIAKAKKYECPVSFLKEDAYSLSFQKGFFNGGLASFWLSHIPKKRAQLFLERFHQLLRKKSRVFMADNVAGDAEGLIVKEGDSNTYQIRKLDGREHLVLKNYFSVDDLMRIFGKYARRFSRKNVFYGKYFWYLIYELK
jgi:ubiquinone/menaquinone biosynthesis C-methylase UbiE